MKQRVKAQKIRKAVIPVAGFGTRFLPATIAQPKEMLPIVDQPIIQYIVEELVAAGIEEIIFVTGRNKRAIEDHFDYSGELEQLLRDNNRLDLLKQVHQISRLAKFVYVRQNKMLGIGDALMCARGVVGDEPFAFANGDDVIDSRQPAMGQLMKAYDRYRSTIIGVMPVKPELVSRYGVVRPIDTASGRTFRIKGIAEKPAIEKAPSKFGVFGRYIFTPSIFSAIEKAKPKLGKELYIADALDVVGRRERMYAHHMTGRYFDCGSKTEFVKANIYYALKHPDLRQQIQLYLKKPR